MTHELEKASMIFDKGLQLTEEEIDKIERKANYDADEIRDAFRSDAEVKKALQGYLDDRDDDEEINDDDDYNEEEDEDY